jgi:hypothetical protein
MSPTLYLGPRNSLTPVFMPRAQLDGTPYGKEIERRLTIEGFPTNLVSEKEDAPQFSRPQPAGGGRPPIPPPPKNLGAPLTPRPPSQQDPECGTALRDSQGRTRTMSSFSS